MLVRKDSPRRFLKAFLWSLACLLFLGIGVQCLRANLSTGSLSGSATMQGSAVESFNALVKKDLRGLIDPREFCNNARGRIDMVSSGRLLAIETTLDRGLQRYMLRQIRRSKSPLIGLVAMDAETGRILAMVDSNRLNVPRSVCLSSKFPAASVFKIVSAAAAIEKCGISADTPLTYNGRRHTLYKNQLTYRINRYTNSSTLRSSFAKSINPVFGKLGIFHLKKDLLEEYAIRFGFNQQIDFELPAEMSLISVGDEPYDWAEIACGFNRQTLISPLHGAMMAGVVVNGGKLVEPTIVRSITDEEKNPLYLSSTNIIRQVISPETSQQMKKLMAETIARGTCRNTFKGYRRDPILSKLTIGGKTGSINNDSGELRYDWFVGFGEERDGTRKLALAVLVVHDELRREKAQDFARLAIRYYFRTPLPDTDKVARR